MFIEDDGASSAGSDIDAEDWNTASFLRETCPRRYFRHACDVRRIIFRSQRKKAALLGFVNVHGGHLRPAGRTCQRDAEENLISLAAPIDKLQRRTQNASAELLLELMGLA